MCDKFDLKSVIREFKLDLIHTVLFLLYQLNHSECICHHFLFNIGIQNHIIGKSFHDLFRFITFCGKKIGL